MLGRFVFLFSFAALVLIAALTMSCGSSSNSGIKPCTGGPYNVVGDWQITVSTGSGAVTGYGAIATAGLALFFDNSQPASAGDTLQLPTITGACSFSGSLTAYSEPGGPSTGTILTDSIQGNVTSAPAISGTLTGSPPGTISAVPFSPLTGSVAARAGARTGSVQGALNGQPVLLPLAFTPSGSNNSMSFTTNVITTNPNQGCIVSGTFTEVGTNNVFDVSITFAPTNCAITGTFSGIGFESSSDYFGIAGSVPPPYLYADILDSADTFVMEIY